LLQKNKYNKQRKQLENINPLSANVVYARCSASYRQNY